jgi:hypothetical protein
MGLRRRSRGEFEVVRGVTYLGVSIRGNEKINQMQMGSFISKRRCQRVYEKNAAAVEAKCTETRTKEPSKRRKLAS